MTDARRGSVPCDAAPSWCEEGQRPSSHIPTGVFRLLLERCGDACGVRVGGRLDHEHHAAIELGARLVARRATSHLAGLTIAHGVDERRIEALARDVGLHGLGATLREPD